MMSRKIISASISSTLYALFLSIFFNPYGYNGSIFHSFISSLPMYMIYVVPAIFLYGIITSILSDKIGELSKRYIDVKYISLFISSIFHFLFGLILGWLSLLAAGIFLITDQLLYKKKPTYTGKEAIIFLLLPVGVFISFLSVISFLDFLDLITY
ncbi:hypothetical protein [Peribacillus frigoritolerans]|uniref:hypothetical protein n=1 Tax=Peribacillus frigoritolerans TaxID=450367 RepID=UPI00105A3BAF|nr:hypothetical protein [Peribacillus frigoritolerans]TDL76138.1 hypothetical protein E2R53_20800 [Peribacillus frigoritolerans]